MHKLGQKMMREEVGGENVSKSPQTSREGRLLLLMMAGFFEGVLHLGKV